MNSERPVGDRRDTNSSHCSSPSTASYRSVLSVCPPRLSYYYEALTSKRSIVAMETWMLNVAAYAINLIVVGSSQRGLLGKNNAEVSDDHPTLVTPAG